MTELSVETTPIPGLLVVRLPVHADARGWFKENWQREKMTALGLPDFEPVQNNVSFNHRRGATRGIHTEPWDKYVAVTNGEAFGAWVDMRAPGPHGDTYGTTFTTILDPGTAVFVPRGVGNSYQTLTDDLTYTYLVNAHWRPGPAYPALDLADQSIAIDWPIPLSEAEISDKDRTNPTLADATPMQPLKTLIIGANGQLGRALHTVLPDADGVDLDTLDVTDPTAVDAWPWHDYDTILNAAAYTAVDTAETPEGRPAAWAANAAAPATLARIANTHRITLVHYSTDYVYDGTRSPHTEDEPLAPLGVYAQTKAAGDIAAATARRHYILRTSWVIGDGHNFVKTMARLAANGVNPSVVDDQIGRLTFTTDLATATQHLLDTPVDQAPYGVYHVTNTGPETSWADIAATVYQLCGRDPDDITRVTTDDYYADQITAGKTIAPRPLKSTLDLTKLQATGHTPTDAGEALAAYVSLLTPS